MRAYISISAHGYGHLAQVAPVVHALKRRLPHLQLVVRSGLPRALLARTFPNAELEVCDHDFGIPMQGLSCASPDTIWRVWGDQCARSASIQAQIANRLQRGNFDFVLSAISPWPIGASADVGVPSFGVGSFSWTNILRTLLHGMDIDQATQAIDQAYSRAAALYCLSPGLGMKGLAATMVDGAVASKGERRRDLILKSLGLGADTRIVLLAFGGMSPIERPAALSEDAPWIWLGPRHWAGRDGYFPSDDLPNDFKDIVASADLVIAKAGYGITSELAALGTPSIMLRRNDWPEDSGLLEWLQNYAPCDIVSDFSEIHASLIEDRLNYSGAAFSPPRLGGEEQIAESILARLC